MGTLGVCKGSRQRTQTTNDALTKPPHRQPPPPHQHQQDKSNPAAWNKAENLTVLPPESELALQPLDRFKAFFAPESLASMFK